MSDPLSTLTSIGRPPSVDPGVTTQAEDDRREAPEARKGPPDGDLLFAAARSAILTTLLRHAETLPQEDWPGEDRSEDREPRVRAPGIERRPRPRVVHPKELGVVHAEFRVLENLDPWLRHGVFQPGARYDALVRFSNAVANHDLDADTRGMAIKLFVRRDGAIDAGGRSRPIEQDFVLATHPAFFVANALDYTDFPVAFVDGGGGLLLRYFRRMRPRRRALRAFKNLWLSQVRPASPLDLTYHSQTPYALGPHRKVKLMARPSPPSKWYEPRRLWHRAKLWRYRLLRLIWRVGAGLAGLGRRIGRRSPDQDGSRSLPGFLEKSKDDMRRALASMLSAGPAAFDLHVQLWVDDVKTPIDDATIVWRRRASPFLKVGTLTIGQQAVTGRVAATARYQAWLASTANPHPPSGSRLAFSPGHHLPEHAPLGSINALRMTIYDVLSQFRRFGSKPPTRPVRHRDPRPGDLP